MGGSNCAVIGCCNSNARIYKWRAESCSVHEGKTRKECGCWLNPPYRLYCFPSVLRNFEKRKKWILALRRVNKDKSEWKPCPSDRVCSEHFVDKVPTVTHPDPSLKMGYEIPQKMKSRRKLFRHPPLPPKLKKIKLKTCPDVDCNTFTPLSDHCYALTPHTLNHTGTKYKNNIAKKCF